MKNLINRALVAEKKILYVAVMALTMVFWVSCSNNPRVEMKYADGDWPDVADIQGYVNGKKYDRETRKCWEVTISAEHPDQGTITETYYEWSTEFSVVRAYEEYVARCNHNGWPAGFTYKATDDSYEECNCVLLLNMVLF